MDAKGIAFLRGLGMPEEVLAIMVTSPVGAEWTIDGKSLESWLRMAYSAGKRDRPDVYAWYSVEELMGRPLA